MRFHVATDSVWGGYRSWEDSEVIEVLEGCESSLITGVIQMYQGTVVKFSVSMWLTPVCLQYQHRTYNRQFISCFSCSLLCKNPIYWLIIEGCMFWTHTHTHTLSHSLSLLSLSLFLSTCTHSLEPVVLHHSTLRKEAKCSKPFWAEQHTHTHSVT